MTVATRLAVLTLSLVGAIAQQAAATQISTLKIDGSDGWRYLPAVQNGALKGLLAEQAEGEGIEGYTAYTVLWHSLNADGTWTTEGYKGSLEEAITVLTAGNQGLSFSKATLSGDVSPCGATTTIDELPGFVVLEDGLAVTDPLSLIAGDLDPVTMEALVQLGAQGAVGVSGMAVAENDPTGQTPALADYLNEMRMLSENFLATDDPHVGTPMVWCFPSTTTTTLNVFTGTPVVAGPNACGQCTYTGPAVTYTTECRTGWSCLVTCTTTTTTGTATETKTAVGGVCPP